MIRLKILLGQTLCTLRQKEEGVRMILLFIKIAKAYARRQSLLIILGALDILLELALQ